MISPLTASAATHFWLGVVILECGLEIAVFKKLEITGTSQFSMSETN